MRNLKNFICVSLLCAFACGHMPQRGEEFMFSVRTFNDGVRWHRFVVAAGHVPAGERPAFINEREDLVEDLRISDWEVKSVVFGPKRKKAVVEIKYEWHRDSEGVLRKTTSAQRWERRGKRWYMTEERRTRGVEMPGLPEVPSEPDEGPATASVEPDEETATASAEP